MNTARAIHRSGPLRPLRRQGPHRTFRLFRMFRRLLLPAALAALAGSLLIVPTAGQAAGPDYTQEVTGQGAGAVRIDFTPAAASALVDVHHLPGGGLASRTSA